MKVKFFRQYIPVWSIIIINDLLCVLENVTVSIFWYIYTIIQLFKRRDSFYTCVCSVITVFPFCVVFTSFSFIQPGRDFGQNQQNVFTKVSLN